MTNLPGQPCLQITSSQRNLATLLLPGLFLCLQLILLGQRNATLKARSPIRIPLFGTVYFMKIFERRICQRKCDGWLILDWEVEYVEMQMA